MGRIQRRFLPASLAVLAIFAASQAHAAQFFVSTIANAGTLHTYAPEDAKSVRSATPVTLGSLSEHDKTATEGAKARGAATASAEVGAVHAVSTGRADTYVGGTAARGAGSAYAEYNDNMMLGAEGYAAGTVAQLTADILINGSVGDTYGGLWDGTNFWRSTVRAGATDIVRGFSRSASAGGGTFDSGDSFGLYSFTFDVFLGQWNNVILRAETGASAGSSFVPGFSDFATDLGHTVAWKGITRLTVGGQEVTGFTAFSPDTGFDFVRGYRPAGGVPEPGAWALMILGFAAAGAALRRRARAAA